MVHFNFEPTTSTHLMEVPDFSLMNGCLESIFIEISFDEKKKIIVRLIYRHPHMPIYDF